MAQNKEHLASKNETSTGLLNWDSLDEDQPKRPSCSEFFGRWKRCTTAVNQIKWYYIFGEVNSCQDEWKDLKMCLKCKLDKPNVADVNWKEYIASKTKETTIPNPVGTIWPKRSESERPNYSETV
eukprot:gene38-3434_t